MSCELVFCEVESRSVVLARCDACPHADSEACEGFQFVPGDRKPDGPRLPHAVAAALPVGMALRRPFVCFEDGLPWSEAERAPWPFGTPYGAPVVDHSGALVGLLPSMDASIAVGTSPGDGSVRVADRAVSAVSVRESESLGRAFEVMGKHRVREVTVVGDEHLVVGVLRDVDALTFVAHVARGGRAAGH